MNILRINDVKNITSMSNSSIYDLIKKNKFPRPRRSFFERRMDLLKNKTEKKNIIAWKIVVTWDNNIDEDIVDIPNDVADTIDNYLTEMENENGKA